MKQMEKRQITGPNILEKKLNKLHWSKLKHLFSCHASLLLMNPTLQQDSKN